MEIKAGEAEVDKKEKKKEPTRSRDILRNFCEESTAHGVAHIVREKYFQKRIVWFVLTLTAFSVNLFHISSLVIQYLRFPSEQTSTIELAAVDFPSVTVCNIQPISWTEKQKFLQDNSTRFFYWDNITYNYLKNMSSDLGKSEEFEFVYNRLRQPVGFFENIGEEAQLVGHQPDDFIMRCKFGAKDCSHANFTYFQDPMYFNCYTFNGGNLSKEKLISRTTGPQEGLSLVMYLESDNGDNIYNDTYYTFSNIGNAAGVRVTIHPPNTRPNPMEQGFDVPPGFSASVGMNVRRITRLGAPFGDCTEDVYWGNERFVYSQQTCLSLCQQRFIMAQCGCVSSYLPIPEDNQSLRYCAYCGTFNSQNVNMFFSNLSCENEKLTEFSQSGEVKTACNCQPPCIEQLYKYHTSYSYWPLEHFQEHFYELYVLSQENYSTLKAYQNLRRFNTSDIVRLGLIRKNFVRLNIYLEDLTIEERIQKKSYEIQNLFSDIGGTLGLYIGLSIITLLEIIEVVIKLVNRLVLKIQNKRKKSVVNGNDNESQI